MTMLRPRYRNDCNSTENIACLLHTFPPSSSSIKAHQLHRPQTWIVYRLSKETASDQTLTLHFSSQSLTKACLSKPLTPWYNSHHEMADT